MSSEPSHQKMENPFTPDRPAGQETEFIGREDVIESIRHAVRGHILSGKPPADGPLVICGRPGIGKTSLLYRLADGGLGEDVGVLYADFGNTDTSTFSVFLWQLAKAIMASMEQQGLAAPHFEKRMLILNPQLVFRQRFWNPLLSRVHSRPLVLVWDNFDALLSQGRADHNLPSLRAYLYDLLLTEAPVDLLLAVTGRVEAIGEDALAPFHLGQSYRLTNLNKDQTLLLIQKSEEMHAFGPVADFIFGLTNGHPGDTQRICHSLYERQMTRGHRQLTMADVIAALRHDLKPSDFVGTVYQQLGQSLLVGG